MSRSAGHILLVEDDPRYAERLKKNLELEGYDISCAGDGEEALDALQKASCDLILTDVKMPRMDGLEFLRVLKSADRPGIDPEIPVLVLTSVKSINSAVEAMKLGAEDYLTKDSERDEILLRVHRAMNTRRIADENKMLRESLREHSEFGDIISASEAMQEILNEVENVASTDATVLITGDTGVGKELVARAIHQNSPRKDYPFVEVNCGALPNDNMFQSDLFGHEKGAFTGADNMRKGRFELAHRGTLFLDEIGDLSLESQMKLLRAIELREFERLGGTKKIQVDVRFVLATNRNLMEMTEEGSFRKDLLFRINVLHINIPPLRDRRDDIAPQADYYLAHFTERTNRPAREFSPEALGALEQYDWPGNTRELRIICERLAIRVGATEVTAEDLRLAGLGEYPAGKDRVVNLPEAGVSLEEVEKEAIFQALERANWVQKRAAEILKISVDRMNSRVRKFAITHPSWKVHN